MVYRRYVRIVRVLRVSSEVMENEMETQVEHEMGTGVL